MQAKLVAPLESPKYAPVKKSRTPKPLFIPLNTSPELAAQLRQLQQAFADVCNAIVPTVLATRCWNRVALHHLVYYRLRERFPQLGSQMICNAIYSVSRTYRTIIQTPASPFNIARLGKRPLPQIRFAPNAPVYFDRHTLSIREGTISMLTLEGRVRFKLSISNAQEQRFRRQRIREIMLVGHGEGFLLRLVFGADDGMTPEASKRGYASPSELPGYVALVEAGSTNEFKEVKELGEMV